MKTLFSGRLLIATLVLMAGANSVANEADCAKALQGTKNGDFVVIPSDRVPSEAEKYREYVKELVEPGGVIEKLGIRMTGQIVEFLQARDLNAITAGTAGGYPVSHYLDGAAVLRSLSNSGGFALEVVYPGPHYQHGFYRDDNPFAEQASIIDHVIGHNSFAFNSGLAHYRVAQGLDSTKELDKVLRDAYGKYDKDEVQRFYLWALTLSHMVDWYTPYWQDVKEFEPNQQMMAMDPLGRLPQTPLRRHPKNATENVLQAFAANLAPNEPPYKRRILELLADSMSFRPALVHTQIMNEGWASIMQEIIPKHTKFHHTFTHWFQASRVMQTETQPNLSDPYSLGVFAWRHLRERFFARPEIAALKTDLEKDRAFIQYAQNEIIARLDDSQFLRLALDQTFIDRYKLAIVRKATDAEQDPNLPPPNPPPQQPIAQWTVVARDAETVVAQILEQVLKPKYWFNPRVRLVNFNRPSTGEVELVLNDEVGAQVPLEKTTLAPSLYAMAQFIAKPVSLECALLDSAPTQDGKPHLVRARITVAPNGDVKVYRVSGEAVKLGEVDRVARREDLDENLTKEAAGFLRGYIEDLYMDNANRLEGVVMSSQSLRQFGPVAIAKSIDDTPYDGLMVHAPNAAGAIMEYKSMVDRRIMTALELAARGKRSVRIVGGTPRVKALPSVVNLQFDENYLNYLKQSAPPSPVNAFNLNRTIQKNEDVPAQTVFGPGGGGDGRVVGPIDGNPGDKFWGPDRPPGDGATGTQPGEDANDPSWVDLPPDLYARFLGERVKLPILNPKPGQSRVPKFKPGRRINRLSGQALPNEIIENAYKRGFGKQVADGKDPYNDIEGTLDAGFAAMQPRDWVVKHKQVTKKPEVKAVVTFVLDGSASTGAFLEQFKRFVYDIKTLIAANYKGFEFSYVFFDHSAHVMKDENSFFRAQLGGGTSYAAGLKVTKELFEENYPRSQWDRYTFVMGDMEDMKEATAQPVQELLDVTEFLGVIAGLHPHHSPDSGFSLVPLFQPLAQKEANVGYTVIPYNQPYSIDNIREVLKNDKDSE